MSQKSLLGISNSGIKFGSCRDEDKLYMGHCETFSVGDSSTEVMFGDDENVEEINCSGVDLQFCDGFQCEDNSSSELHYRGSPQKLTTPSSGDSATDREPGTMIDGKHFITSHEDISWGHDANQLLRRKYNPRMSLATATSGKEQRFTEREMLDKENFDKGENPMKAVPIDINEPVTGQAQSRKNYVIDYRDLRRSGYFLTCQKQNPAPDEPLENDLNFAFSKVDRVGNWLNCFPAADAPRNQDSEDDLMGEHGFQNLSNSEFQLPNKCSFKSEVDILKSKILNDERPMRYSSKPLKPFTYKQLETILETANDQIFDYLEKLHKSSGYVEHEYVSGKIEISSFRKEQKSQKLLTTNENTWKEKMTKWASSLLNADQETCQNEEIHNLVKANPAECTIILEPYHGPIQVNGATIESGSTNLVIRKGIIGTVVEEVKAALKAISNALRRTVSPPSEPTLPSTVPPLNEDPEIQRLTAMLQSKESIRRPNLRTVFGLKNTEKIPSYSMIFRRRQTPNRRPGFFRAVNGWIQRKSGGRNRHGRRYRILSTATHHSGRSQPQRPERSNGRDALSGNVVSGIISAIRATAFQMTPAIPVTVTRVRRNEPRARGSSRGSLEEAQVVIPTRYQILRTARSSTKTNSSGKKTR